MQYLVLLDLALLAHNFNQKLVLTIIDKLIYEWLVLCYIHLLGQVNKFFWKFLKNFQKNLVGFYCVNRSHGSIVIKCLYCLTALFALGTAIFYGFTTYKVKYKYQIYFQKSINGKFIRIRRSEYKNQNSIKIRI